MDLRPLRTALASLRTRVRGLYLVHGIGRGAACLCGLLLLSFALDVLLAPPRPVRIVHAVLSLAVLGWAIRRFLVMPLRRSVTDLTEEELALAVEARVPRLGDRLVGALQWERILADPECGESSAFMEASVAEAAAAVRTVRASDLTEARPARRSALLGGAAAGLLVLVTGAWHAEAAIWVRRSLLLLDEEWPRRTTLVVLGFDAENPRVVTIGDDLPVTVRVEGSVPDDGVLVHYETLPGEGGRTERDARPMGQSAEDPASFAFAFHEVPGSFRFWVTGGDDVDGEPRYTVRALVPPAVESIAADLAFPAATGLPPERRTEGDLEVPAGTEIRFAVRANVQLRSAAYAFPATGPPVPLELGPEGRDLRFTVVVNESADWRLDMESLEGARSQPARCTHRLTALPDPRPEVRMVLPSSRTFALADGRVPVKVLAKDNYSLVKVALEVVPGRGRTPVEIGLGSFPPAAGGPVTRSSAYRLLDLPTLWPPEGEKSLPQEDEVILRGVASDNGGSTAATEPVAIQITDAAEMLRRLSQKQTRIREDLDDLKRHLEGARNGAIVARDVLQEGGPLPAPDREALRVPSSLAGRSVREASALTASLGDVLLTYCLNRLVENRVASDRIVSLTDDWLREDAGDPDVPYKPALWRRLSSAAASRDIEDNGILGSLLTALGLADRLAEGPAEVLRARLDALAGATAPDTRAAAGEASRAADEALALVKEIGLHLQEWESMHEILEATRSIMDQQDAIRRSLQGSGAGGEQPKGR
jgi:hypothetical protein